MAEPTLVTIERSAIADGRARLVTIDDDLTVAVFRAGEAYYAIDNRCPHQGGPLGEGRFDGTVVTCPWHGFTIDVRTGRCPRTPGLRVRTFAVEPDGDLLRIMIPA